MVRIVAWIVQKLCELSFELWRHQVFQFFRSTVHFLNLLAHVVDEINFTKPVKRPMGEIIRCVTSTFESLVASILINRLLWRKRFCMHSMK